MLLAPELKTAKVKMRLNLDRPIPAFLMDEERLQQVFVNLIKNAIAAMPRGGTLTCHSTFKDKLCFIQISDTGVGIPEEQLPQIFDAYYTTREEGSGLGLMIVQQIIQEHGGRIEVASRMGKGTTFTVILPMRKERLGLPNLNKDIFP